MTGSHEFEEQATGCALVEMERETVIRGVLDVVTRSLGTRCGHVFTLKQEVIVLPARATWLTSPMRCTPSRSPYRRAQVNGRLALDTRCP